VRLVVFLRRLLPAVPGRRRRPIHEIDFDSVGTPPFRLSR
jgi:hypothetical protein